MPRYKAIIEYYGTPYHGWQRQENTPSVQEEIEHAIYQITHQKVSLICAGRTDTGVHALGQVAHFDLEKNYPTFKIQEAINFYLKEKFISFLQIELVDNSFHARFNAKRRHYIYKIINRRAPLTFKKNRAHLVSKPLDLDAMRQGASYLLGEHDFNSFRASQCSAKSSIKTIYNLEIKKIDQLIEIHVCANAFLHHMVRNIVGTLIMVGLHEITPQKIEQILAAKSRVAAGPTAPSCGLYFLKAEY